MNIREENELLRRIAERAATMLDKHGVVVMFIESELRIVHREICELRLKELLEADTGNFAHDVIGIHEHVDLLDGSFRDGWSPRMAAK